MQAINRFITLFYSVFSLLVVASCSHAEVTAPITSSGTISGDSLMIIFQDKSDNYWFGSYTDGVYRLSGKKVTHFTEKDGLCSNSIRGIQEDEAGAIYFSTANGISRFDGQSFKTLSAAENNALSGFPSVNDLWFPAKQGEGGAYRYDGQSLHFVKLPKSDLEDDFYKKFGKTPYSPYDVYTVFKDSKGAVFFGTSNLGVCRFDGEHFTWISESDLTELSDGPSMGIRAIVEDQEDNYWFGNTIFRYQVFHDENDQITYRKQNGIDDKNARKLENFMSAVKDRGNILWFVTLDAGVWSYDGKKLTHYPVMNGGKMVKLYSVYEDKQGVLWLGSHESGVYRFNGKTFEAFEF